MGNLSSLGNARTMASILGVGAAAAALGLGGCGGTDAAASDGATAAISASTTCADYLKHPAAERQQQVVALTQQIGAPHPGDPQWGPMVEARCPAAPDLKLGDFFNHFG